MIIYSLVILIPIFQKTQYVTDENIIKLKDFNNIFDFTIEDIKPFDLITFELYFDNRTICDELLIGVNFTNSDLTTESVGVFGANSSYSIDPVPLCTFEINLSQEYQSSIQIFKDRPAIYKVNTTYTYALNYNLTNQHTEGAVFKEITIVYDFNEISSSGKYQDTNNFHLNLFFGSNEVSFSLIDYIFSDSIIGIFDKFYETLLLKNNPYINSFNQRQFFVPQYQLKFTFPQILTQYKQYPKSLIYGLTQIGGLLGFLKLASIVIQLIHGKLFENLLRKKLDESQTQNQNSNKNLINDTSTSLLINVVQESQGISSSAGAQDQESKIGLHSGITKVFSYDAVKQFLQTQEEHEKKFQQLERKISSQRGDKEEGLRLSSSIRDEMHLLTQIEQVKKEMIDEIKKEKSDWHQEKKDLQRQIQNLTKLVEQQQQQVKFKEE